MHDVSSQPKVTDLHNFSLSQEDITSSQVTVHTLYGEKWSCSRTCFFHEGHCPCKRVDFLGTVLTRPSTEQAPANRGREAPGSRTSKVSHRCALGGRRQKWGRPFPFYPSCTNDTNVLLTMLACDCMDPSPTPCFDPPPSLAPWLQQCHRMQQGMTSDCCFDFFPPWWSLFTGKWERCLYLKKEYYIVSYGQNLNLKP